MFRRIFLSFALVFLSATALTAQDGPVVGVDHVTHDFKLIKETDGPKAHSFKITNMGKSPLVINRVTVSCGCTRPSWSQQPIAPQETAEVTVAYDPAGRMGAFYKTVHVYTNAQSNYVVLNVMGEVVAGPKTEELLVTEDLLVDLTMKASPEPVAKISDEAIDFGELPQRNGLLGTGGKVVKTFTITNTGKAPLKIRSINSKAKGITISGAKTVKPQSSAEYKISINAKRVTTGTLEAEVTIISNDSTNPVQHITVTAVK